MAIRTFGKTASETNFMFGKLPVFFKVNDSYKDGNDEGLLERYLEIFCAEIDGELSPYIDEVLDITDAEALSGLTRDNPTELLTHISELFGDPPDIGTGLAYSGDEDNYIALIRYIANILRTRGTTKSLEYFLALYDYEIDTLTESTDTIGIYDATPTVLEYDSGSEYDGGFTFYSGWDLVITDQAGTATKSPPQAWLDDYLKPAIQTFISPIWAELGTLTYV